MTFKHYVINACLHYCKVSFATRIVVIYGTVYKRIIFAMFFIFRCPIIHALLARFWKPITCTNKFIKKKNWQMWKLRSYSNYRQVKISASADAVDVSSYPERLEIRPQNPNNRSLF